MSGDVQPRKRKDKKRKKDDLGVEEPRGTAAVFGEGDVFMHSHHDHGTGGHWCAKVIFFSLLAVLVTLIGLIILENRGLTELEANAVESKYSGVLDGWTEDVHDDHHDEHTLELKHHVDEKGNQDTGLSNEAVEDDDVDEDDHNENDDDDDEEDENGQDDEDADHDDENDQDDEDVDNDDEDVDHNDGNEQEVEDDVDHDDEDERDDDDEDEQDDDDEDEQDDDEENESDDDDYNQLDESEEQNIKQANNEAEDEQRNYRKYYESDEGQHDNTDNDDDERDKFNESDDEDADRHQVDDNDKLDDVGSPEEDDDDDDGDNYQSLERNDDDENSSEADANDDDQSIEDNDDENETPDNEEEDNGGEEQNLDVEVEKIEKEASDEPDEEPTSTELPFASNKDKVDNSEEKSNEQILDEDLDIEEEEFLEPEDIEDLPVVERITAPAGKPLPEVEEETSSEKPQDTLAQEEEYEKQQEQLRREKEQASHMWLKVVVGGALLVATHAVVRRATASRDEPVSGSRENREETPLVDRRMTLIPEEISAEVPIIAQERYQPTIQREIVEKVPIVTKSVEVPNQDSEGEEEEIDETTVTPQDIKSLETTKDEVDRELYSDEDEEEEIIEEKKESPRPNVHIEKEITPDIDEDSDDVEIIDDEQLDEELLEEEDEEEISDVDDAELLRRLEAKYGRLPEPERPGQKHKDGGNSVEDDWPGEPSEAYWREQLDQAERELRQGEWEAAAERAGAGGLRASGRARLVRARALDAAAEARRDNALLSRAVAAYLELLKMNDRLSDKRLVEVARRTLDRIQFRGNYMGAEPVYRLLIRRFPDDPAYRNNLTVSFLMANRADLAEEVLMETLQRWPDDRVALAHLGFVLKTSHNRLEEAVDAFQRALAGDTGPATEPRFYYHLGDALLLLGRHAEAHEVHKRGAALGHFLSPSQRSLYNVDRLRGRPWWNIDDTPYTKLARALEKSWKEILKEGEAARAIYEMEKEGLRERGEWSQLDLFVQGREIPDRCKRAPVTCSIVRQEAAAAGCRRGQVKFSSMEAGTRVRPHVGPTNCRLRMHLGLSNTKDTYIRVDQEIRQWQLGKVLMFDDSFEHEVWHNGTGTRLVLIVDVWHPDLTPTERRQLPAI